jgi:hypothetical protein
MRLPTSESRSGELDAGLAFGRRFALMNADCFGDGKSCLSLYSFCGDGSRHPDKDRECMRSWNPTLSQRTRKDGAPGIGIWRIS